MLKIGTTIMNVNSWLREGGYFFFDLNLANIIPKLNKKKKLIRNKKQKSRN